MDLSRRCALKLEAAPPRFRQVRRIVQAQLRYWQLEPLIDSAVLALTELLANVHKHAQPNKRCTIELAYLTHHLTVSVHDADPRLPVKCSIDPMSTRGRGLGIVAALTEEWGVWPDEGGGKTVWFTLGGTCPVRTAPPRVTTRLSPLEEPVATSPEPVASLN